MGLKHTFRRLPDAGGFTLVELIVVVSIIAILAAVATPAYINYVNRSKQSEAAAMLLTARLEMEEFYTDYNHYAQTMQCLPSFVAAANTACINSCSACNSNTSKPKFYTYRIASATTSYYRIAATRQVYSWVSTDDNLTISSGTDYPIIQNTNALKFSLFKWLFQ